MNQYEKLGYLTSPFRIFHLIDNNLGEIPFHYHDFHKILIHLSGNCSYNIEGRSYELMPYDIVLVNAGEVHRPVLHNLPDISSHKNPDNIITDRYGRQIRQDGHVQNTAKSCSVYERIIIYVSKEYLDEKSGQDFDLGLCFKQAQKKQSHVLRLPAFPSTSLGKAVKVLDESNKGNDYAKKLHHEISFLEFMIQLNRATLNERTEYLPTSSGNQKMVEIIDYLNRNLTSDISVDTIAGKFYISRYHLMHSFKEETGYSIGNYITTKRLLLAKSLITSGQSISDACFNCGFKNYSTFSRAYKKAFGQCPSQTDANAQPECLSIVE